MTDALAGHAGEAGSPLMPHEVMGGIALLLVLMLLLAGLTALLFRRLRRLEQRLRALERTLKEVSQSPSPPSSD